MRQPFYFGETNMNIQPMSVLCITPPHMLQEIIRNGSSTQRDIALRTLITSEQMRGQRHVMKSVAAFMGIAATTENKQRLIYDAKNGSTLPGTLVISEGDLTSSDPAVNETYDGSGVTYDLYLDIPQRRNNEDSL
jgi:Zn-dependent metalloprotease